MYFGQAEINFIVAGIWEATLGQPVEPSNLETLPEGHEDFLTGSIQITGKWEGTVILVCATPLAREATALMFGMDGKEVAVEQIHDALGELTNIIGGNLKALLPQPCYLGQPRVATGSDPGLRGPDSQVLTSMGFRCRNQPIHVSVLERDRTARHNGKLAMAGHAVKGIPR